MNNWMREFYKNKQRPDLQLKYFNLLYDKCKKMNLILSKKEEIQWNPEKDWASFTIYSDLKKYEENKNRMPEDMWEEFSGFNRKYCNNPDHILYIDKSEDYPTLEQAIEAIHECGGLAFMPHLFIYKSIKDKEAFINDIITNYDVDGLECYHSEFSEEEIKYLLRLTEERNLLRSGGSDYHGSNKKDIEMAIGKGNLKIENSLVESWI